MDRPRRSALFLPASNARALEKARSLPCDAVILDLEDAVAPETKSVARDAAVRAIRAGGFGRRELVVRVNGPDTPWGADDLEALSRVAPDAVLIPKVSDGATLQACAAALGPGVRLWAMIESCTAVLRLDALGAASGASGCVAWVVGPNDLAREMRCRPGADRAPLLPALALTVLAARAHGLAVLDGVFNDISDADGLAHECRQGAALGFDGKTLIHPAQIVAANAAFGPGPDEMAWARRVVAAFEAPENAGQAVLRLDGRMVELLHLAQARALIAFYAAITAPETLPRP
jgi:citrate lyase subunit beta/citryl-CoA lyase